MIQASFDVLQADCAAPPNGDERHSAMAAAAQACRACDESEEFGIQLRDLLNVLQDWAGPYRGKIQSAQLVVRERDLLFRVTQKDAGFDRELVDSLTELDLAISNRRDLRLIDLEVMATPPAGDEATNSMLSCSTTDGDNAQ